MRSLKVKRYVVRLIDMNEYLALFLGATLSDKIADLNKPMFQALIENIFRLRKLLNFLIIWKSQNLFMKV